MASGVVGGHQTRISVRGKFLFAGDRKLYIRGVTYGTFRPDQHGAQFPAPETVEMDFSRMEAAGINAVRVYTPPPVWLLDVAWRHGLYVMVGLPWEQHIAFLDQPKLPAAIERRLRGCVRESAGHPAVLCYVVGNEIPSSIVRWSGPRRIERFIRRLYKAVKEEAPASLVTYVNFPTTEYLDLPFLDFSCFNVYLESPDKLEAYLAQLQNLAGDRPLIMAEVGLDSCRNGEALQAQTMEWQIRTVFASGCAGIFVFAWTDEWHRGGHDIPDWDFGLTRRDRSPKAALSAVRTAFAGVPFPSAGIEWPGISVVVCTHNGAGTLRNCLEGIKELEYPNYEVIVVDDGSTDDSATIAKQYPVRLIQTENHGLSSARNTGSDAANGEIVAYTDDDARPDPHWLHYLAWTYLTTDCAAVGGPNIPPPDDGPIAECVANAPGGPMHVMITHRDAEHIPGCNFSFRRDRLAESGGFDPRFKAAGDDVDICWRFLDRNWKIGFHPGAMVWHHRRDSLGRYWKQQKGYGHAEALLEAKWPSKYNTFGEIMWTGRIYGQDIVNRRIRSRVYHGPWGTAPFQRLYSGGRSSVDLMTSSPQWYMLNLVFAGALSLTAEWSLLQVALIPLLATLAVHLVCIGRTTARAPFVHDKLRYRIVTGVLHLIQPVARFWGRTAMRRPFLLARNTKRKFFPAVVLRLWSEEWRSEEYWLEKLRSALLRDDAVVRCGGAYDPWDLEVRGWASHVRLKMAIEEHGAGKQMVLFRLGARLSSLMTVLLAPLVLFTGVALFQQRFLLGSLFGAIALTLVYRVTSEYFAAASHIEDRLSSLCEQPGRVLVESLNPLAKESCTGA